MITFANVVAERKARLVVQYNRHRAFGWNATAALQMARKDVDAGNSTAAPSRQTNGQPWPAAGAKMKSGLRFLTEGYAPFRDAKPAHDVARIKHTGWFVDEFQDEKLIGIVFTGRHGKFYAGYQESCNDGYCVDVTCSYESDVDAAITADSIAENAADAEREFHSENNRQAEAEEAEAEAKAAAEQARASRLQYVATYGDAGLEISFYNNEDDMKEAVQEAEEAHKFGRLDSYTWGDAAV